MMYLKIRIPLSTDFEKLMISGNRGSSYVIPPHLLSQSSIMTHAEMLSAPN